MFENSTSFLMNFLNGYNSVLFTELLTIFKVMHVTRLLHFNFG